MLPLIALVGRPNVGKSTLFNVLTKTREALVADFSGLTRDRQYGRGIVGPRSYVVVDTGGIDNTDDNPINALITQQIEKAIDQADKIFFIVDAQSGLTATDQWIAQRLRASHKPLVLVVNKADRLLSDIAASEFYALGFESIFIIAASMRRGIAALMEHALKDYSLTNRSAFEDSEDQKERIHVALLGRPNVGKSTLINRLLNEERVIANNSPFTTRDSLLIPFDYRNQHYLLIDTAGIRRKAKISDKIEKFSIIQSLKAIDTAHVVIVVINAKEGINEQDLRIIRWVIEAGRGLIMAVNQWDGLDQATRDGVKKTLQRQCQFASFARHYFISALYGTGVNKLYGAINETFACANQKLSTALINQLLIKACEQHPPPSIVRRQIKLRYAHISSHHPLTIMIHGKQLAALPHSYQRYLIHYFQKSLKLVGVPLLLHFKTDKNPYNTHAK